MSTHTCHPGAPRRRATSAGTAGCPPTPAGRPAPTAGRPSTSGPSSPTRGGWSSRRSRTWPRSSSASRTARSRAPSCPAPILPWPPTKGSCSPTTPCSGLAPATHLEPWAKGLVLQPHVRRVCPWCSCGPAAPVTSLCRRTTPARSSCCPSPRAAAFLVREHAFLAASDNVDYTWQNAPGLAPGAKGRRNGVRVPGRALPRPVRRRGRAGPGCCSCTAPATCSCATCAGPGHPGPAGSWVYADTSVTFGLHAEYPASGGRQVGQLRVPDRLDAPPGPGRVAVRSIFEKPERYAGLVGSSGMSLSAGKPLPPCGPALGGRPGRAGYTDLSRKWLAM